MSGAKETPRQKMIGMMYLVYTALLAMNVSADILDAFAIVNDGQEKTNASIELKINEQYAAFEQQLAKDESQQTIDFYTAATEIRTVTTEVINYIEKEVKLPLLLQVEGLGSEDDLLNPKDPTKPLIRNASKIKDNSGRVFYELELKNIGKKDDYDVPTTIMIEEGKATELKGKINEYRQYIVNKIGGLTGVDYSHKVGLLTDYDQNGERIVYLNADKEEIDWEHKNFSHIVFVAEMAILNKIVGEIQTTEYDAVSTLMSQIGATDYKFNKLQARIIAKSDYITQGQDYEAEVFLVASDTTRTFKAKYALGTTDFSKVNGNATMVESESGIIKLKFPGRTVGEQKYAGVIMMTNPKTGEEEHYDFSSSFMVAQPSATIAPTKMMVMYSGLANPISISAPGYTSRDINIKVTGGKVVKEDKATGEYLIVPNSVKEEVHVVASAMKDGKNLQLKDQVFRVKPVPTPRITIGGVASGKIAKAKMFQAGKIVPEMPDFDFEGYNYEIISYKPMAMVNNQPLRLNEVKGPKFSAQLNEEIQKATRGQVFYFDNIVVKAPDGSTEDVGTIKLEIE